MKQEETHIEEITGCAQETKVINLNLKIETKMEKNEESIEETRNKKFNDSAALQYGLENEKYYIPTVSLSVACSTILYQTDAVDFLYVVLFAITTLRIWSSEIHIERFKEIFEENRIPEESFKMDYQRKCIRNIFYSSLFIILFLNFLEEIYNILRTIS